MVVAATIDGERLLRDVPGWSLVGKDVIRHFSGDPEVRLFFGDVPEAAAVSDVLIGLGGTANQICAGLGVPVVSIDEKGKRVQKKLLGDAESLVPSDPAMLAAETVSILRDADRREVMSKAGRERMGEPGALDSVVIYASETLGWTGRHDIYRKFSLFAKSKGAMKE
jgi:tetraacyldisaccharide 4'-kinase